MAIGPFTFDTRATGEQRDVITPALEEITDVIGSRLKAITLVPMPKAKMPDWNEAKPGVQPAWELWKGWNNQTKRRELWYWDQLHLHKECVATIEHGSIHAYDELYMSGEMKADIMDLMHARPEAWLQGKVWAKYPYECNAVYGSAALFGITNPVYDDLLSRHIDEADWPKLRTILLR